MPVVSTTQCDAVVQISSAATRFSVKDFEKAARGAK
jgi:hypothetical protein